MLVDNFFSHRGLIVKNGAHSRSLRVVHLCLLLLVNVCGFKEATERLEEPHYLWLAQDIWKYCKVGAEAGKAIEVEQPILLISIEEIKLDHGSVHASQEVHYFLVLEYLH